MSVFSSSHGNLIIDVGDDESVTFTSTKLKHKNEKYSNLCHEDWVTSVLYFGPPHRKIVTCSHDNSIKIWNCSSPDGKVEFQKKVSLSSTLYDLLKINDETFCTCSADGDVHCLSILPNFDIIKEIGVGKWLYQMVKLSDDIFLCHSDQILHFVSYSKGEVIKKLCVGYLRFSWENPMIPSKNYPLCFYVATNDDNEEIKLIDYNSEQIVKEFKYHSTLYPKTPSSNYDRIRCLSLIFSSRKEEILISWDSWNRVHFYNTTDPQFTTKIRIDGSIKRWTRPHRKYRAVYHGVKFCFSLNNEYVVCGSDSGIVFIFQFLENERKIGQIKQKKVHGGAVTGVQLLSASSNMFRLVTSSQDKNVSICEIKGLNILLVKKDEAMKDLEERVQFLSFESEKYCFGDLKSLIVGIRIGGMLHFGIPKSFLLL